MNFNCVRLSQFTKTGFKHLGWNVHTYGTIIRGANRPGEKCPGGTLQEWNVQAGGETSWAKQRGSETSINRKDLYKKIPWISENNFKFNSSGLYGAALSLGGELQSLVLMMSGCSAQCIGPTLLNNYWLSGDHWRAWLCRRHHLFYWADNFHWDRFVGLVMI